MRSNSHSRAVLAILLAALSCRTVRADATEAGSPRERLSIDAGWRFHKGDPEGLRIPLDYDLRPEVTRSADGKAADARPQETAQAAAGTRAVLKPWILPTGNAFIADPAKRHARPAGDPGGEVSFVQANFDDSGWETVDLPHDWAIAGPFLAEGPYGGMGRLPSWGVGWYRTRLDIPASDAGRSIFLDVGGAMSYATVWLNGRLAGGWPYGYSSWRIDLTPYLAFGGVNQLAIRLDNPPESARWYPGGGLYRSVWLTKADPVHVAQWGTYVTTPKVSEAAATVRLRVFIDNDSDADAEVEVATAIHALDDAGMPAGEVAARIEPASLRIAAKSGAATEGAVILARPRLWGPPPAQQPNRYVATTTISRDGRILDRYETRFGIREVRFDPDRGLIVNGERIPIRGVNNHHDLGALGAAFNPRAAERQLEMLREMGANAVRMAHNPPAPELLDLADRMGLLVVDEIFDAWETGKTPLDFHLVFRDWHEPDLRAMLRRDRNHPSVILWSIGNEVGEQYTGEQGAAIARRLHGIVREEDPTRPTTTAMNWAKPDMPLPAAVDVIGLNYQGEGIRQEAEFEGTERIRTPPQYPAFHAAFPDKAIVSTETASAFSSRGVYLFPVSPLASAPTRDGRGGDSRIRQVSAYELHAVDFGASADKVFASLDRHPFVAGEFVWTGFDYLGEPTPYYASRSSYTGIIDLAGFPKDRYYLYQSRWRPDLPMAHLLPHWTWPGREGQVTPVHVFTSGDEAELFVNGTSQGRRRKGAHEYRLRWDEVVYEPGEIRVQAYRDGRPWAGDAAQTAGAPARLELLPDRDLIRGDGTDLSFVTVRILDAQGRPVPTANPRIRFGIEGPAQIVATDNGDPTDMEPFVSHQRDAFNGLGLAIVRGLRGQAGTATLRAESDSLQGASAVLRVEASRTGDRDQPAQDRSVARAVAPAGLPATLKDAYADAFRIGTAVNAEIVSGEDAASQALVMRHFDAITPENAMKAGIVNPAPGVYDFSAADAFVRFGQKHDMFIVGHPLVWHNQTPAWFFTDADGRPNTREAQIERMRRHIETVAGRYRGRVDAWDVVNEVIGEDGAYRADTAWVKAVGDGDELVRQAFRFAHRYAPDAELYYNDFNTWRPAKRAGIVRMVKMLQNAGIRIDGIGMQGHWGLDYPPLEEIEASIDAYAALGVKVMITELDVDVLPLTREGQIIGTGLQHPQFQLPEFERFLDPYPDGLPPDVERQLADRYADLFRLFHRKRGAIDRVTLWGVHDGVSWKNDYPVPGRSNYPLLFDRARHPKPALRAVLDVPAGYPTIGGLTAFDDAFHAIVPADARIEKIAEGFAWAEGPAWMRDGNYLLFTDVPENRMYRWSARDGLSVLLEPSGYSGPDLDALREPGANGLFAEPGGTVLLADSGSRQVARFDPKTKARTTLAAKFQGRRFNSPNDLVRRSDGAVFFTDPPYGLKGIDASPARELRFSGVYRLDADGTVHLLDDELAYPNGIALSPDERTLYVANSDPARPVWMAYSLDARGGVSGRRVFADASDLAGEHSPGLPDGIAVASDGRLFATGPGGVIVFDANGTRLGRIETGGPVANCAFGDDGRTLYMTSHTLAARIRVNATGLGFVPY